MRFEESRKRSVLSSGSANTLGRVDGFVVDVETARVSGVRVGRGDGDHLAWDDVQSFGPDAVTVSDDHHVRQATADDHHEQPLVVGSMVLDTRGTHLGVVSDVEFDPASGRLRYLLTEKGEQAADRLRGIGSYAVVLAAEGSDD